MSENKNETKMIIEENKKVIIEKINLKMENIKAITIKLKELFSLVKNGHKFIEGKRNIIEYITFPELFPFNKLKNLIYDIFNIKNNEELYNNLLSEINDIFNIDDETKNIQENINLKYQFYKLLEQLSYFISPSIIFIGNDNSIYQEKALDYFHKFIIHDNIITRDFLSSYITIFNLYNSLKDYYSINRKNLFDIEGTKKILFLIDILKMHNIYTLNYVFQKRRKLFMNINNLFYELYKIYNSSLKELYELTEFIIKYKRNKLPSEVIERILNENIIKNQLDKDLKSSIIENLMINYSLNENKKKKEKGILLYFVIIINNNNILSKNYIVDFSILNNELKKCITGKEYDKIINFFFNIKNTDVALKYINNDIIEELFKSAPFEKIFSISEIIKDNQSLINDLLKKNNLKNSIKLIRALKLKENQYDKMYDDISINNFFYYKINACLNESFDILIDFSLINSKTFNTCLKLLFKNLTKEISNNKNNTSENNNIDDDTLPLIEEEENNNNNDKEKKKMNNFNDIMNFFIKENKNKNNLDKDIIKEKKEKILTLINLGKNKGYEISEKNKKLFDKEFANNDELLLNINYNKYIIEDKCAPHDSSCININLKTQKIIFVDNSKILEENLKFFRKSKFIGIDSEWSSSSFSVNNEDNAAILQLCNYCEKNILIIDLLKMKTDKEFFDLFENNFKDKIFIGYAFNKSDIDQFFDQLQNMFKYTEIIDLIDLYQNKYLEKAPSLKIMCEKILGKKMCKYEQCSFWEKRPLKKSQLHYAALDALICISIYKKLLSQ